MKHRGIPAVALGGLLVTLAGCEDSRLPVTPSVGPSTPAGGEAIVPNVVAAFPPASGAAAIYDRTSPSVIPGSSRYVLYEDGTFRLQYVRPDWSFFEYLGRYSGTDSAITFDFDARNLAGPWDATGIIGSDSLTVHYNEVMTLVDFEDGVYSRAASSSDRF